MGLCISDQNFLTLGTTSELYSQLWHHLHMQYEVLSYEYTICYSQTSNNVKHLIQSNNSDINYYCY